jgi:hypothetical protein
LLDVLPRGNRSRVEVLRPAQVPSKA